MIKVGFSGSRYGMTPQQQQRFLGVLENALSLDHPACRMLDISEFHHGDWIGSDSEAHLMVREHFPEVAIVVHPPDNDSKRGFCAGDVILKPRNYLVSSRDIVRDTYFLIGCPINMTRRAGGTWRTIEYAKSATNADDWKAWIVLTSY